MDGPSSSSRGSLPIIEKFEYDAAIGGNCRIENEINTFQHCHDRLNEIKAITSAITNPNNTKLVFQKLPKHMRRRAMSHNPNRLPRKYRLAHRAQMSKSGAPAKAKRPSRKYRRKPCNLLLEYQRRQRTNVWLETHIWHAKRFHMVTKWGYKLAQSSCDKTFRSSYRATRKHCLVQDISYMGCIELRGPLDVLKDGFERMRGNCLGLGICAKAYTEGKREGSIELFAIDSYPYGALGNFQFIWRRPLDQSNGQRQLWLFAHPSIYQKLVSEICKLFALVENTGDTYKVYTNETAKVELHELKNRLNRFRLTGPLAHAVLMAAFKPKVVAATDERSWFKDYLMDDANRLIHETQSNHWTKLKVLNSAAELPPGIILAMNIEDPRINRPKKRSKAKPQIDNGDNNDDDDDDRDPIDESVYYTIPNFNGDSSIWENRQRDRIENEKVSTHEICVQRNKNILVPGERCEFETKLQAIPVLVIQRRGTMDPKRLGYGGGYDVIIPPGYGISTWMCLIMWGAKPGALRETETITREALNDQFLPDTQTAVINSNLEEEELRKKYFRKPPNKRQNYIKSSIASPFKCPWSQLIREWCTAPCGNDLKFHVLRDKTKLNDIERFLSGQIKRLTNIDENCLIPVALAMNGRGNANKCTIICLPTKQDLRKYQTNRRAFENTPILTEPIANDTNELTRKRLRLSHLTLLKRLRRRRVRVKRKKQEYSERKVIIASPQTATLIRTQYERMCELWLPISPRTIRQQCSREVFGYLTHCQFMFHAAKVCGIGYVTVNGIRKLSTMTTGQKSKTVLVRDANSLIYRLATISIRCG